MERRSRNIMIVITCCLFKVWLIAGTTTLCLPLRLAVCKTHACACTHRHTLARTHTHTHTYIHTHTHTWAHTWAHLHTWVCTCTKANIHIPVFVYIVCVSGCLTVCMHVFTYSHAPVQNTGCCDSHIHRSTDMDKIKHIIPVRVCVLCVVQCLTIQDGKTCTVADLGTQFFVSQEDVDAGRNR